MITIPKNSFVLCATTTLLALLASPANSEVITVEFSGEMFFAPQNDSDGFLARAGVVNGDRVEGRFTYDTETPASNTSAGLSQYYPSPNDYSFTIGGNKAYFEWNGGGSGIAIRDNFSSIGDMFTTSYSGNLVNSTTGETSALNTTNSWIADNTGTTWSGTALPTLDVLTNLIDPTLNPGYQSFSRMQGTFLDFRVLNFTMSASLGSLDQSNEPLPVNCSTTLGATTVNPPAFAQTITVGETGTLTRIDFSIQRPADYDAGDVILEIRNVESGVPGPVILGSKTFSPSELLAFPTDSSGLASFDVSDLGIQVTAGEQVGIVWTRNAYFGTGGKNLIFYCSGGTVGDPDGFYVGGGAFNSPDQGATWSSFNSWIDFRFRTYVSPPAEANEPPTANAGQDQSIRAGDTVMLDGTESFDDNTASANLTYSWSFTSLPAGSDASLDDTGSAMPSFVADVVGTYVVQLLVTDEAGLASASDEVVISSENLAPTANAGDDQLVIVGTTAILDGTASSDPELDTLSYSWTISVAPAGSIAALSGADTATAILTPDVEGIYTVTLEVSDAIGPGTPDSVQITASTAESFSETQIVGADDIVTSLAAGQVTTSGNQNALSNFLDQAVAAIQAGDLPEAIDKLEKAIERTDGCILRGTPDGNGKGRDWIVDCATQVDVYNQLNSALVALSD